MAAGESTLEFARDVHGCVQQHIRFADTKAAAIIGFVAAVAGAIGVASRDLLRQPCDGPWLVAALVGAGLALLAVVVFALICVWNALHALLPRTWAAPGALASFPDIQQMAETRYLEAVAGLDAHRVAQEYSRHTHILSRVALEKFDAIKQSIQHLRLFLIASLSFLAMYVVARAIVVLVGG